MDNDKRLDDIISFLADVVKIKELEQCLRTKENRKEVTIMCRSAYHAIYPTYATKLQETPERIYLSYLAGFKPLQRTRKQTVDSELTFLAEVMDVKKLEQCLRTEDNSKEIDERVQKAYQTLYHKYETQLKKTCEGRYLSYLAGFEHLPTVSFIPVEIDPVKGGLAGVLGKRVDELELTVRSANCLQNAGIDYVWQLVTKNESELLRTKNFGRKSLFEINDILAEMGLTLGMQMYAPEDQTDSF